MTKNWARNLIRIVRKNHTFTGCLAVSRQGLLYPDFNSVLTSCISSGYGTILDQIANDIPSGDLITQKGLKLAKLIPKLDKIFQSLLTPNVNQTKLQSFEARIFETFCLSKPH